MKNTRKLLALLLALILTLGCLTAWAEDLTWNGNTLDVGTVSPSSVVENPDSGKGIKIENTSVEVGDKHITNAPSIPDASITVKYDSVQVQPTDNDFATGISVTESKENFTVNVNVGNSSGDIIVKNMVTSTGVDVNKTGVGGNINLNIGNVSVKGYEAVAVSATAENSGTNDIDAADISSTSDNIVTGVDATAKNGGTNDIMANSVSAVSDYGTATGVNAEANGANAVNRITIGAAQAEGGAEGATDKEEPAENYAVVAQSAENADACGVYSMTNNGATSEITVNGGVYAEGETGWVDGVSQAVYGTIGQNTVTVNGSVKAVTENGWAYGILASDTVTVNGDVTASASGNSGGATAIDARYSSNVTVDGDVTADSNNGGNKGILLYRGSVLVTGTAAATTGVALQFYGTKNGDTYNLHGSSVTTWAANVGGNTDSVAAIEYTDGYEDEITIRDTDAAAAAALKNAISYIVKHGAGITLADSVVAVADPNAANNGNTETYRVAHEDDRVSFTASLGEDEELDGVYYYQDAKDAGKDKLAEKDTGWGVNDDGSYWVKMLRGGGMLLGLKTHTHNKVHHDAKAATCTEDGWEAYDTCSREGCDYTTYKAIPALNHNKVHHDARAATCTEAGWNAYDTCSREGCNYTTYEAIKALGHDKVHHDAKAATCTEDGWEAYDTCSREGCDYTTYEAIPALNHDKVHHDAKAATCTAVGWNAYDTCSRCDYTTYEEIPAKGHVKGKPVKENEVAAKPGVAGSYDEVVYCKVCNVELSREKKTLPALPTPTPTATATATPTPTPTPTPTATPTPTPTATPTATPTPAPSKEPEPSKPPKPAGQKKTLVYSNVDSWRGLNPAEHPGMGDALKQIARSIHEQRDRNISEGVGGPEGLAVRMWYLDEGVLVPANLLNAFSALSLEDRLLILTELLGCGEPEGLSADGEQVLSGIRAAVDAMTPEQQAARQADMDKLFLPRSVTDENGVEHRSVGIELEIQEGSKLSYEHYTFYVDADEWKLFSIETGTYRET